LGAGLVLYGIRLRGGIGLAGEPLTATYVNRNLLAALLGLILLPAVCFSLGSRPRAVAWLSRAFLPVLLGGILLTKSRGGIMGTAAAIATVCLVFIFGRRPNLADSLSAGRRRRRIIISVLLILLLGSAVLYGWFRLPESFPISPPHPEVLSIRTRLSIWRSTVAIFLARPVTGWGWGTFRYLYPAFKEAGVWYTVPHAHNEFLQLLAEGGVIGFALVAFSLVLALGELVKKYSASPRSVSGLLALGAAGSLVCAAVHSGFDFILRLPANALFLAALVGLGLSAGMDQRESPSGICRRPIKLAVGLAIVAALVILIFLPLLRFYRSEVAARQGERLLASGRAEEAREIFSRAHEMDSSSNRPLLGRAAAGMAVFKQAPDKTGLYASIVADLETARRNNPRDTRPLRRLSRFHRRLSALEAAGGYLAAALALDPVNPYLYYELAEIDLRQGDYLAATHHLRQASSIYVCIWGPALKLLFSYTDDYEILKELPPPEDEFHRSLGYHLLAVDNPAGAEEEFQKAAALDPVEPENRRALGVFYARTGKPEESRKCYQEALSLSPENHHWLAELGDVLKDLDMLEEALDLYLQARALDPGRRNYSEKAGSAMLSLKGPPEAIAFWGMVSAEDPEWSRPYFHRSRLLLETGQLAEAEIEINQALSRQPGDRHYSKLKARIEDILLRKNSQ
jgi:tetratricopeptide (TPR) repeat protein